MILNSFIEPAEPGLWRFWFDTLGISRRPPEPSARLSSLLPDSQTGSALPDSRCYWNPALVCLLIR
jgi:hypothetical protein